MSFLTAIISCVALSPKHLECKKDGVSYLARMKLGSGKGRGGDEIVKQIQLKSFLLVFQV